MNKITGYFTHSRHFNCSVILLTQDYSKIPPTIKKNTDIFIFFQPFQRSDREYFFRFYFKTHFNTFENFNIYLDDNLKHKYDFVVIIPSSDNCKIINRIEFEEILNKF